MRAGRRPKSACSGIALIGIIMVIVVLGFLGGSVLMLTTSGSMKSLQALNWSKAFFAAESGISLARTCLFSTNPIYTNLPWTGMVGSASFSATIETNAGNNVIVSSIGIQGDSRWTSKWRLPAEIAGGALVVYHEKDVHSPRYRTWSNTNGLSTNELTALQDPMNRDAQWYRIMANPLRDEYLLAVQDEGRRISAQTWINGTWVSNTLFTGTAPADYARGFDIAYEQTSGRGMMVYSVGTANPQYCIWDANRWSNPIAMDVGAGAAVQWIRLVAKPESNEIMCLARWRTTKGKKRNYSSAIVWNGSAWIDNISLEEDLNSKIECETMDATYSASGALVVYIGDPSAEGAWQYLKYRTYTTGWSPQNAMSEIYGGTPYWIRVEYSADGALAYAAILQSGRSLEGTVWNGSAWGPYTQFSTSPVMEDPAKRCFDIAWSSRTNILMVAFCLQNEDKYSYWLSTNGTDFTNGLMPAVNHPPAWGSWAAKWCVLKADPLSPEFFHLSLNKGSHVNFQRWDGAAWTNYPEPEVNSEPDYLSIDMAFSRNPEP
ncbi:MAG: hypothetical protein PHP98_08060 [Kiritimatiellae bacterium]|nr:hypothetical protein [Kiritimatiellia bacterium]